MGYFKMDKILLDNKYFDQINKDKSKMQILSFLSPKDKVVCTWRRQAQDLGSLENK